MSSGYTAEMKNLSDTKSYLQCCVKPRHLLLLFIYFLEAKYPDLRREYWALYKCALVLQHAGDLLAALFRPGLSNMTKQQSCS